MQEKMSAWNCIKNISHLLEMKMAQQVLTTYRKPGARHRAREWILEAKWCSELLELARGAKVMKCALCTLTAADTRVVDRGECEAFYLVRLGAISRALRRGRIG